MYMRISRILHFNVKDGKGSFVDLYAYFMMLDKTQTCNAIVFLEGFSHKYSLQF